MEATFVQIAWVLIAFTVAGALIALYDSRTTRKIGGHARSQNRNLLLASELPACAAVPKEVMKNDPYNALYDTENSYPDLCPTAPPTPAARKEEMEKAA